MEYVVSTVRDGAGVVDGASEVDDEVNIDDSTDDAVLVMVLLVMIAGYEARALCFTFLRYSTSLERKIPSIALCICRWIVCDGAPDKV